MDLLYYLRSNKSEIREFLSLMSNHVEEALSQHQQKHYDIINNMDKYMKKSIYDDYDRLVDPLLENKRMLTFLYKGMDNFHNLRGYLAETRRMLQILTDGINSICRIIQTYTSICHQIRQQDDESVQRSSSLFDQMQIMTTVDPSIIIKAFNGLRNMKGNDNEANKVLIMLTTQLNEATTLFNKYDKWNEDTHHPHDIYKVLYSTRGLYPHNSNNSPLMNKLHKALLNYANSCSRSCSGKTISLSNLYKIVYSFQNLITDNKEVRNLLNLLTHDIKKMELSHDLDHADKRMSRTVTEQDMTFGIRGMKSYYPEVREFLEAITILLNQSKEIWNADYTSSTLTSLQYLNSDDDNVCEYIKMLSSKFRSCKGNIPYDQLVSSMSAFRGLDTEKKEVRELLSSLISKSNFHLRDRQDVSSRNKIFVPSFLGLQRMSSEYDEVRQLLNMFSTRILMTKGTVIELCILYLNKYMCRAVPVVEYL